MSSEPKVTDLTLVPRLTHSFLTTTAIGPLVGGSLVKSPSLGWKAVFLVSLPLNAVCAIFTIIFIPLKPVLGSTKDKVKKIDFVGTFLISTGTILLLLALNWGGLTYSWSSYQILLPLSLSVVLIAAFVFWEWKGAKFPIIPLAMFKNRTVSVVIVSVSLPSFTVLSP